MNIIAVSLLWHLFHTRNKLIVQSLQNGFHIELFCKIIFCKRKKRGGGVVIKFDLHPKDKQQYLHCH